MSDINKLEVSDSPDERDKKPSNMPLNEKILPTPSQYLSQDAIHSIQGIPPKEDKANAQKPPIAENITQAIKQPVAEVVITPPVGNLSIRGQHAMQGLPEADK